MPKENGEDLFIQLQIELSSFVVSSDDFETFKEIESDEEYIIYSSNQKSTGKQVSIRSIKSDEPSDSTLLNFCHEIQVLSYSDNPFLVPLIGFIPDPPISIITRYVGDRSLYQILHSKNYSINLTGDQKNIIAIGIAYGMLHLHQYNISHRDLRSSNILLDESFHPYIFNYQYSTFIETYNLPNDIITCTQWSAPELFTVGTCTNKVDVYSFGMILWELETGFIPFKGRSIDNVKRMLLKEERPAIPPRAPQSLKKLIQLCWHQNPEKRPTFGKIFELFLTKKVFFDGTKNETIEQIKEMIETYEISKNEFKTVRMTDKIPLLFKELDPLKILNYTNTINEFNCKTFFDSVIYLIQNEPSVNIVQIALFELLKLLITKKDCLSLFVESYYHELLPFEDKELQKVSLSILIPIFEEFPQFIRINLLQKLELLIPLWPQKIIRLFSIIVKKPNENIKELQSQIINILIIYSNVFVKHKTTNYLIHIFHNLIDNFPEFKENKIQYYISFLLNLLNKPKEYNLIEYSYSSLCNLKVKKLNINPNVILTHLNDEKICKITLDFLGLIKLNEINLELLKNVYKKIKKSKWGFLAFLNMLKNPNVNETYVAFINDIFNEEILSEDSKVRVLIILLKNENFSKHLSKLQNIYIFLKNLIIDEGDQIEMLNFVYHFLKKIDLTNESLELISNTSFLKCFLDIIIKNDQQQFYLIGYLLICHIGRFGYLKEYLLLLETSLKQIKENKILQFCILSYYTILCNYKETFKKLIKLNVSENIENVVFDDENKEFAKDVENKLKEISDH